jgi:hypothetical protein
MRNPDKTIAAPIAILRCIESESTAAFGVIVMTGARDAEISGIEDVPVSNIVVAIRIFS